MTAKRFLSLLLVACCGLCSCAQWRSTPKLPARHNLVLDQLVVFSDSPLPEHHRLLEELRSQRSLVSTKLNLPISDEPIHVYLFTEGERLDAFMQTHYPSTPHRRAFFVETDARLSVYAHWGDHVAEDLRHEVAHGYLHAMGPRLPLWLDEGLAEYFETPRGQGGVNRPHVAQLAGGIRGGWKPELSRLERLQSTSEMNQADYAESWAWVHYLLETSPERAALLRGYLAALAKSSDISLREELMRLDAGCVESLADHVLALDASLK